MLHILLTAAMAAGGFALAPQDASSQTGPAAQDESIVVKGEQRARDKRVCKRAVSTGSIMTKSTCKTAGEWEIERERSLTQMELIKQRKLLEDQAHLEKFGN